jgi:hypothetical protein
MYSLLVKLMIFVALLQLGMSLKNFESCRSRSCSLQLERHSREVLNVDWKPISVFPDEARRFH